MPARLLAVSVVLLAANLAAAQSPWSQWQGNAAHTGTVSQTVATPSPTPAWTVTAASLGAQSLVLGSVADKGLVYFTADMGNNNSAIFARASATGAAAWSYSHTSYSGAASAPSLGATQVYANFSGHSGVGVPPYLIGVNATSGAQAFATSYSAQGGYSNQPTVSGNAVFSHAGYYGGMQGVDGTTGAVNWTNTNLPQQTAYIPAADTTNIYFYIGGEGSSPGPPVATFYAMNKATGAISYTIQNTAGGPPLYTTFNASHVALGAMNDALVVSSTSGSSQNRVVSFNLATHAINWSTAVAGSGAMAVDAGRLYVPAGGGVRVLDEATGTLLGTMTAGGTGVNLTGNVLVTNNLVFVSSDANTYAFNRTTFAQVWTTNRGGLLAWGDGMLLINSSTEVAVFTAAAAVPEPSGGLLAAVAASSAWRVRRRAKRA